MKYKYIISLFIVGILFQIFGAWAKITHQAYGNTCLNVATIIMICSGVLAIIKILTAKSKDSFLNK